MSDITVAPEQDAIADSLVSEESQEQVVEQPETEQQREPDVSEQPVEQQEQEVEQEVAEDWLPSEQDKVFPDDIYAKFAERYKITPEVLEANPSLRYLLHDSINREIYIRQQREQEQFQEEPEPEPVPEPTREQPQPQITREQHFQN